MAERYSIPDIPLAASISSLLLDLGIITSGNRDRIIDRNAVRRQRKRYRSENIPEKVNMNCINFDGKIDSTLQSNRKRVLKHIYYISILF